jgi:hypothetical protein
MRLKRLASIFLAPLALASCGDTGNTICGAGTMLDVATNTCFPTKDAGPSMCPPPADFGGTCQMPDLSMSTPVDMTGMDASGGPDMACKAGATCGTNTALDAPSNSCKIASSACLIGTTFDPVTATCKVGRNYGTQIFSTPMLLLWIHLFYQAMPVDGGVPDGGPMNMLYAAGMAPGMPNNAVPANTQLFTQFGVPIGGVGNGPRSIPVIWPGLTSSPTVTAIDHQLTFGEFSTCTASWAAYNNPPDGKKNYFLTLDLAGCPANMLLSTWNIYSRSNLLKDAVLSTPSGGLPMVFTTQYDGTGHWEREEDPNIWFLSGATLNGSNTHNPNLGFNTIPSLTTYPNATMELVVINHNSMESNGNAGFCEKDANGVCVNPASPDHFLPGAEGVDSFALFQSFKVGNQAANPIPLGMLQPY